MVPRLARNLDVLCPLVPETTIAALEDETLLEGGKVSEEWLFLSWPQRPWISFGGWSCKDRGYKDGSEEWDLRWRKSFLAAAPQLSVVLASVQT